MSGVFPKVVLISLELLGASLLLMMVLREPAGGAESSSGFSGSSQSGSGGTVNIFSGSSGSSTSTPTPKPTSPTSDASRGPSSIDTQNTYHVNGGAPIQAGGFQKETIIDGKTIPKVIDFGGARTNLGGEAPHTKQKSPKPKRTSRKQADQEDDGLNTN